MSANAVFLDLGKGSKQTDITAQENSKDDVVREAAEKTKRMDDARRALMSPPGVLHLPEKLERKRLEHGIIDAMFVQATFDRCFVWQLPAPETYQGSGLIVPEAYRQGRRQSEPCGVLLSAGARALDFLYTNGIEVGDTVYFTRLSPKRIQVESALNSTEQYVVLVAADIILSVELTDKVRAGKAGYEWSGDYGQHVYMEDGKPRTPRSPWQEEG